jgi:hypothetical protein
VHEKQGCLADPGRSEGLPDLRQAAEEEEAFMTVWDLLQAYHRVISRYKDRYPYIWYWRRRLPERKGQRCKITARGAMNSIRVEFPDGFAVITSRFAVRKAKL